jgi:Cdc6-like AAA superfamily ATPase
VIPNIGVVVGRPLQRRFDLIHKEQQKMAKQTTLKRRRLPSSHVELLILGLLAADEHAALFTGTDSSTIEELYDLGIALRQYCSRRRYLTILQKLETRGQIVVRESHSGSRRGAFIAKNGGTSNILCRSAFQQEGTLYGTQPCRSI